MAFADAPLSRRTGFAIPISKQSYVNVVVFLCVFFFRRKPFFINREKTLLREKSEYAPRYAWCWHREEAAYGRTKFGLVANTGKSNGHRGPLLPCREMQGSPTYLELSDWHGNNLGRSQKPHPGANQNDCGVGPV